MPLTPGGRSDDPSQTHPGGRGGNGFRRFSRCRTGRIARFVAQTGNATEGVTGGFDLAAIRKHTETVRPVTVRWQQPRIRDGQSRLHP